MRKSLARRAISSPATDTPVAGAPSTSASSGRLAITRDALRIALFVLTVLTVSRVHQHYPIIAKVRPALLLSLAAAAYAWMHPKSLSQHNVFKLWPMRRIAVLGIIACCSAVFG